ncbi:MAG: prepilin peptidase [Candidatus Harrisonbacteria bacterium]|nr:prepilin peptidase [Candidatus Harrisonbacteria bacterium]
MLTIVAFAFGLLVGSFLNVLGLRYKEGGKILSSDIVRGRSYCPACKKTLQWYELVPLVSFLVQRGRCWKCKARISLQYPFVELLSAFLTVGILSYFSHFFDIRILFQEGVNLFPLYLFTVLWLIAGYTLIVMSIIDLRFRIIPDQLNLFLAGLGLGVLLIKQNFAAFFPFQGSFLFSFQDLVVLHSSVLLSGFFAAAIAGAFFILIVLLSRGKGMGLGDVKLVIALGLLLSWPDIMLMIMLSFIIGSLYSLPLLLLKKKSVKSAVPFGPFIAVAVFATIFLGQPILSWYFSLI